MINRVAMVMTPYPFVASIDGTAMSTIDIRFSDLSRQMLASARQAPQPLSYCRSRGLGGRSWAGCRQRIDQACLGHTVQRVLTASGAVINSDLICRVNATHALIALRLTVRSTRICSTTPSPVFARGRASGSASAWPAAA